MPPPSFQRLRLPQAIFDDMIEHARRELPGECCGFLAGVVEGPVGRVVKRYPLVNAAGDREREFHADPAGLPAATKDMRHSGLDVLAIYHSHPTSAPVPSTKDLARHWWGVEVASVIISPASDPPVVRAWWLTESDYREAEYEIMR